MACMANLVWHAAIPTNYVDVDSSSLIFWTDIPSSDVLLAYGAPRPKIIWPRLGYVQFSFSVLKLPFEDPKMGAKTPIWNHPLPEPKSYRGQILYPYAPWCWYVYHCLPLFTSSWFKHPALKTTRCQNHPGDGGCSDLNLGSSLLNWRKDTKSTSKLRIGAAA